MASDDAAAVAIPCHCIPWAVRPCRRRAAWPLQHALLQASMLQAPASGNRIYNLGRVFTVGHIAHVHTPVLTPLKAYTAGWPQLAGREKLG